MEARAGFSNKLLLVIAYVAFISLGLPDTLIGVAWPSVRETFALHQRSVGLVFIASGCGYFVSGFFTGRILHLVPIGLLLAASSALVATSAFSFSAAPLWAFFVTAAVMHGLGSGAIDGGLNNYAAHHFSARQMNWLHACYSIGATFGPLIMTAFLLRTGSWRSGYAVVGFLMLLLAAVFFTTRSMWMDHAPAETSSEDPPETLGRATVRETLRHGTVWLHIAFFFVYTGLEVTVGQWSFTLLTESRHLSTATAGLWVTLYWGSIGAGRVLFGFVVDRIGIDRLLRASTIMAIGGAFVLMFFYSSMASLVGLVFIGFALAPIYPSMMTRTPQRLGRALAAHAIGFQVASAMLGAAALPGLTGVIAQQIGLRGIPVIIVTTAALLWCLHETLLRRNAPAFAAA